MLPLPCWNSGFRFESLTLPPPNNCIIVVDKKAPALSHLIIKPHSRRQLGLSTSSGKFVLSLKVFLLDQERLSFSSPWWSRWFPVHGRTEPWLFLVCLWWWTLVFFHLRSLFPDLANMVTQPNSLHNHRPVIWTDEVVWKCLQKTFPVCINVLS